MKGFTGGFKGFFTGSSLGAAAAFLVLLVLLAWAGVTPQDLANRIPPAPWRR